MTVLGTAQGLTRLVVKNLGTVDWRGLIYAAESRDFPDDPETAETTAHLVYEAEALTPLAGAAEKERSGASGGKVIRHEALSNAWQAILSSEIDGVGHQTHKGPRRIWVRIYDPGSTAGEVELRLEWRALGSSRWSQNAIVATPRVDDFAMVDLGECRPEVAVVGDGRWEWQITARTTGTAGADIDLDKAYVLPTEQYLTAREPLDLVGASPLTAEDSFTQSAGNLTGKVAGSGQTYVALAGSDTTDFTIDTTNDVAQRTATSDTGSWGGFFVGRAVGLDLNVSDSVASVALTASLSHASVRQGLLVRTVNASNFLAAYISIGHEIGLIKVVGGTPTILGTVDTELGLTVPTELTVVTVGDLAAVYANAQGDNPEQVLSVRDSVLGSTLASGDVYLYDENPVATAVTRTYDNLTVRPFSADAVCFAGRSIELRSDGVYRQDADDDVWGRIVPEGFLPFAAPSGLEERPTRSILIPSQGDLGTLPDTGTNKLSVVTKTRAAYHYAREAA